MTEQERSEIENSLHDQIRDPEASEEELICQIKSMPEAIGAVLRSDSMLFLWAVLWNRFAVAQLLADMGADVHSTFKGSLIAGNALNVAHSPEQAEYLLGLGIEIEKNLDMSKDFINPAIAAARHNDKIMVSYWLDKQKELFQDDQEYISALILETVDTISMMNQSDMIAHVMEDEQLYDVLKDLYAREDSKQSIKLTLSALREIEDEALEPRKQELIKILRNCR